jgi:hypothetical protein
VETPFSLGHHCSDAFGGAVVAGLGSWLAKMLTLFPSMLLGMGWLAHFFEEDAPDESARQSKPATMATRWRPRVCYSSFTASLFATMTRFAPQFCCTDALPMQLFCWPRPKPDVSRLGRWSALQA